ncbi:MAG: hypothetical protein KAG61_06995 [Bacteriovoracaceae bacterium]|nr:hypothetical protein [Bacteriovoracaceae bacterium]
MNLDTKWIKTLALALSLPGTILVAAFSAKKIVEMNLLSPLTAIILFLLIVGNSIFLMVYYAFKNKDKS